MLRSTKPAVIDAFPHLRGLSHSLPRFTLVLSAFGDILGHCIPSGQSLSELFFLTWIPQPNLWALKLHNHF